jgi:phosphoglycerate dehydrogenase-like enzyme
MARLRVVAYTRGDTPVDDIPASFSEIDFTHCTRPDEGCDALPHADVLFIARRITHEDARHISKQLKWLHISGAGADHVLPFLPRDLHPVITNARGLSADLIAEYTLCTVLMLRWQMGRAIQAQAARHWDRWPTVLLTGQTFGVVGLGTIGKAVARRARGIGMRVVGVRRQPAATEEVDTLYPMENLHAMLAVADATVVTVPLTPATANLIDADALAAMPRHAILTVVGRGGVVDESALVEALNARRLAGAALDVFAQEPLDSSSPLWNVPNLLVTSHIAGELPNIRELNAEFFKENLRRFINSEPLLSVVDREAGY